ncbi:MAG TPA: hypothetical protein VM938_11915 [Acidimicrobiales bacterium]|nr:hypothetical protein [Acidimicrobiales bacterium]
MRTLKRLLVAAVAVSAVVVSPSPAEAHNEVCAGQIVLFTGANMPIVAEPTGVVPEVTTSFTMSMATGACSQWGYLAGSGMITGSCAKTTAFGTANGHYFSMTAVGTVGVSTGQFAGAFTFTNDETSYYSCLSGRGRKFVLSGTWLLTH